MLLDINLERNALIRILGIRVIWDRFWDGVIWDVVCGIWSIWDIGFQINGIQVLGFGILGVYIQSLTCSEIHTLMRQLRVSPEGYIYIYIH